jgi:hypothetical protein
MKKSGIPQISKSSANLFSKDNLERKTGQELDLQDDPKIKLSCEEVEFSKKDSTISTH